jgi:hypothetical protein
MFNPDPNFSVPDPRSNKIPRIRIEDFQYLKIVSKLSEIRSGMSIPNPDIELFLPIPDPRIKKASDLGSATPKQNSF